MSNLQNKIDTFAETMFASEYNFAPFNEIDFGAILRKELFEYGIYTVSQTELKTVSNEMQQFLNDIFQGEIETSKMEEWISQPMEISNVTLATVYYMAAMKRLYNQSTMQENEEIVTMYVDLFANFKEELQQIANVQIQNDAYMANMQEILK